MYNVENAFQFHNYSLISLIKCICKYCSILATKQKKYL